MKAILVDLDGTLFDTKEVNYNAYKKALEPYEYDIDYEYYCTHCNGRHYMDFLPQISTPDQTILEDVHNNKKKYYKEFLKYARVNECLLELIKNMKEKTKIAIVTTASKESTLDILREFHLDLFFDLILTQEDVNKRKPDPEGYIKAMEILGVTPQDTLIFEDSEVGIKAAELSGAQCFVVKGFN